MGCAFGDWQKIFVLQQNARTTNTQAKVESTHWNATSKIPMEMQYAFGIAPKKNPCKLGVTSFAYKLHQQHLLKPNQNSTLKCQMK
jgi:hypothetical protein